VSNTKKELIYDYLSESKSILVFLSLTFFLCFCLWFEKIVEAISLALRHSIKGYSILWI